jgi:hypothetical protein
MLVRAASTKGRCDDRFGGNERDGSDISEAARTGCSSTFPLVDERPLRAHPSTQSPSRKW